MYSLKGCFSFQNVQQCDFLNVEVQPTINTVDHRHNGQIENNRNAHLSVNTLRHDYECDSQIIGNCSRASGEMIALYESCVEADNKLNTESFSNTNLPSNNTAVETCHNMGNAEGVRSAFMRQKIKYLVESSYDAVIFCLLLEYIPTPELRLKCCEKAYRLLRAGGVLVIVTPDSKHVGRNVYLYKYWQMALMSLGFMRIKYEKHEHFHAMAFRKGQYKELWVDESQRLFADMDKKKVSMQGKHGLKLNKFLRNFAGLDITVIKNGLLIPQDMQKASEQENDTTSTRKRNLREGVEYDCDTLLEGSSNKYIKKV